MPIPTYFSLSNPDPITTQPEMEREDSNHNPSIGDVMEEDIELPNSFIPILEETLPVHIPQAPIQEMLTHTETIYNY